MSETWWQYVERVSGSEGQAAIARKIGVNKTTAWRWKDTGASADHAVAIRTARVYGRPVTEALAAAGHITYAEADLREVQVKVDPSKLGADELAEETKSFVDEMRRRLKR